jgi:hypothetical protein
MPAGRPSSYDPEFADRVIPFMADGYSLTAFAGEIGVSRQTIYNWAERHPEFLDAVKTGEAASQLWWERRNRGFAETGEGNATAIIFGLKNRAAEDWCDKRDINLSGNFTVVINKPEPIVRDVFLTGETT